MVIPSQGDSCCWICTSCEPWQIVLNGSQCHDCADDSWPDTDKTHCYRLPQQHVTWDSIYAIVPAILAAIGIALTLVLLVLFIRHRTTPVVKASGRELCFILMAGFLVCFSMTFILLAKPTLCTCALARIGIGLGFTLTYASLLTKTNRIARIFAAAKLSAQKPVFISPKSQVVITGLLVSVQVLLTGVWFLLEPPGVRLYHPGGHRHQIVLKCNMNDMSFLYSLSYNMLLIVVCTVYAVKTRHIPANFNESKFIGFTMYTTCIIWLAFLPIYFGTLNAFQVRTL